MKFDRGILAALGAAALFGFSTPIAKPLAAQGPPLLLAGLLYLGSGLGLAVLLSGRALIGRERIVWPRGVSLLWLLGATAFGGVLGPFLLMYGLRITDAASASLILNLEGVFTALLAWFAFRENFDRHIAMGMALIVAGGMVLSTGPALQAGSMAGPTAIAGACLAWAVDNNLTRKVAINDAMMIACVKGLVAGAVCVGLALQYGAHWPSGGWLARAGLLGFVSYGLSLTLFVVALRRLGTARTGAYFSVAPFVGAVLAVALGAPLTGSLGVAALFMAAGVWLHLSEQHSHWHRHLPMKHDHSHVHDEHHQHSHSGGYRGREPHAHVHVHEVLEHAHRHFPDVHHRHEH